MEILRFLSHITPLLVRKEDVIQDGDKSFKDSGNESFFYTY